MSPVESFLKEKVIASDGNKILFTDIYSAYSEWAELNREVSLSKIKLGREIAPIFLKGRDRKNKQVCIGNITWRDNPEPTKGFRYVLQGENLERITKTSS